MAAGVWNMQADRARARGAYARAAALFGGLAEEFPEEAAYRHPLAQSYYHLGRELHDAGQAGPAAEAFAHAAAEFRQAHRLPPHAVVPKNEAVMRAHEL